jgi:prolyl 4-hydroxylase
MNITLDTNSFSMQTIDNFHLLKGNDIYVVDNFLDLQTCNRMLLSMDSVAWTQSGLVKYGQRVAYRDPNFRNSHTIYESQFGGRMKRVTQKIERMLETQTNLQCKRREHWEITKYRTGEKFGPHLDAGVYDSSDRGDRAWTVLIYLMSPSLGGETFFRAVNCVVTPRVGRLVYWRNLLPTGLPDHAMIHEGRPVVHGLKIILNTWIRER